MPDAIATLPPPTQAFRPMPGGDDLPEVPEYAFSELWQDKKEGIGFGDLLDIVNPLQHIPVVSTIYRLITGDQIGIGARLAGGALFGGPFGALGAGAVAMLEGVSGKTVEQHVAALFEDGPAEAPAPVQVAELAAPPEPVAQPAAAPTAAEGKVAAPPAVAAMVQPGSPAPASPPPAPAPAAADRPGRAAPQAAVDSAAERQRLAQAIEHARRAQAGLLLASIEADREAAGASLAGESESEDGSAGRAETDPAQPFRSHPYMLPPGAPPQLVSRAMEQALLRYQALLQQRNAAATAAAPRATPAPVR